MSPFQYLTIQDVLWINQQVTLTAEKFDFARLEESVFYQYALGNNAGLTSQATRFLRGFLRLKPFEVGSEATAFIACAAYLRLNGKELTIAPEAARKWLEVKPDVAAVTADAEGGHLDVRAAVGEVLARYGSTLLATAPA